MAFLVYQLFGTSIQTNRAQSAAEDELVSLFEESRASLAESGADLPPTTEDELSEDPVEVNDDLPTLFPPVIPAEHEPFAKIVIPKIELDVVIWEGVDRDDLKNGPGHMPWTAVPGQPGNSVISGHRTTYGAPFFDLDELENGDVITVETPIGVHQYEVREKIIVAPTAVEVTEPRSGAWLTLTTCHPISSSSQRLVIHAELVDGPNVPFVEAAAQLEGTS